MERSTRLPTLQFRQIAVPHDVHEGLAAQGSTRIRAYRAGDVQVLVSVDLGKWHLSISTPRRYPTWDEIADARYALVPDDVTMAMLLPPRAEYVNLHATTFHLHEL
jgi:hypothetical protein